jgi:hypothetical protein
MNLIDENMDFLSFMHNFSSCDLTDSIMLDLHNLKEDYG